MSERAPVDDVHVEREQVEPVDAPEVHAVRPRLHRRVVEGVDPAGAAEVVVHHAVAEAVAAQHVEPDELREVLSRDVARRHDRTLANADGAVAAQPRGDLLAREGETHRAAVAASAVGLALDRHDGDGLTPGRGAVTAGALPTPPSPTQTSPFGRDAGRIQVLLNLVWVP